MKRPTHPRTGLASILVLLFLPAMFLFAFLILSIDRERLATTEIRKAGVAASLAAAAELAGDDALTADANRLKPVLTRARQKAQAVAKANAAGGKPVSLPDADVVFGHTPRSAGGTFTPLDPNASNADWKHLNAVEVTTRLSTDANKWTRVRATFDTAVTGFRPTALRPIPLVPVALYDGPQTADGDDSSPTGWTDALSDRTDDYKFDPETGVVSPGADGLAEVVVVIGLPYADLPPVVPTAVLSIGAKSSDDALAQIGLGIRTTDLTAPAFANEFSLFPATMTRPVPGSRDALDDRLADAAKALTLLVGKKRVWPLFADVDTDPSGRTVAVVNGFAAARILKVDYVTGDKSVRLTLQEAVLATPTAVTRPAPLVGEKPPPAQKSVGKVRLAG